MKNFKMSKKAATENIIYKILWIVLLIMFIAGVAVLLKNFING